MNSDEIIAIKIARGVGRLYFRLGLTREEAAAEGARNFPELDWMRIAEGWNSQRFGREE